jgi:hypothetical protein
MGQSVNSVHCGERTFRSFTQTFILCLGDIYRERGDWPVVIYHQMCVQRHGVSDADMEQSRERAKPIHPSPAHAAGDSSHTHTLHPVNLQQHGKGEK